MAYIRINYTLNELRLFAHSLQQSKLIALFMRKSTMRSGTLLLEGFCGLKQLKSLYMPTHVARSIGINFWSGGCNGHVLVILLYNPSNSFSLTATRKPAGTYDRAAAVRSMKCNSVTQAVLNFRGISFVTGGWRQNRWRGR